MKKPKYSYDDTPDESRPYRRMRNIMQYGTAKITKLPTFEYLDVDEAGQPLEAEKPQQITTVQEDQSTQIKAGYKFTPEHYNKTLGVLTLSPYSKVAIAKRGKAKKKDGQKTLECRILDCVFKTVNSQKTGVDFSTILTLSNSKIGTPEKRKIRNAVDTINKKVVDSNGPERLIIIQNQKVFVNNSYL